MVTSSFAHKDIDHLLRNLTAILVTMPIIERLMKQKEAVPLLKFHIFKFNITSIVWRTVNWGQWNGVCNGWLLDEDLRDGR